LFKRKYLFFAYIVFCFLGGCVKVEENSDVLFQVSTINALLEGVYDGEFSFGELKSHGDLGLGTFNSLDGEMTMIDGEVYQVRSDGKVYIMPDSAKTPFSVVTFFEEDTSIVLDSFMDYKTLEEFIDKALPTKNIIYAIKIEGLFKYIHTRSVPAQEKPYPPLAEVVKTQPQFEFYNERGTLVGFRMPDYINGINVPKYHLHFVTEDRKGGGHLLDCVTDKVKINIDFTDKISVILPKTEAFYKADLNKETNLGKIER
jgi:acetolactate decarboxylase